MRDRNHIRAHSSNQVGDLLTTILRAICRPFVVGVLPWTTAEGQVFGHTSRDELDEAAERGRREGDDSKEAVPEEVGQPGSGGKDNVREEWAESQERRQNSQFAKPGPGLWASRVNFARMEFSEVRPPWVFAAHAVLHLVGRPTSGYIGRLACLAKVVGKSV
jgi:hypothetical protein